jgi:hypothetical protein
MIQDIKDIVIRHRKFLFLAVALPTLTALVVSLIIPKQYLSQTSVLPANSRFSDKSRFTAEEITELYSVFSSGDDLDRLYATARSRPVMMKMVDSFGLIKHYKIKKADEKGREEALRIFRTKCGIFKTEYGEMHVKVTDRDRVLAAAIANGMVFQTEKAHQDLYRDYYSTTLRKLESAYSILQVTEGDVRTGDSSLVKSGTPSRQLDYYRRAMTDIRMALLNPPSALVILERAVPSVKAESPKVLINVVATMLVSLFTAFAMVLLLPGFKKS